MLAVLHAYVRSAALRRAGAMALAIAAGHAAAASYTESVNGDFSNDRLAPTFLQLDYLPEGNSPGSNVITGTIGRNGGVVDLDYLTVNVPVGYQLSALRVGTVTTVGGSGSFIGLAAGGTMPVLPSATNALGLLGYRIYRLDDRNTDILDDMAVPLGGSSGFAPPLSAGDYTFWIQELATGTYTYSFDAVLTPVPGPAAAAWLLAAGLLALGARTQRASATHASLRRHNSAASAESPATGAGTATRPSL